MALQEQVKMIIYRFRERGLEIFLENSVDNEESWQLPAGSLSAQKGQPGDKLIELDAVEQADGQKESAWAVEGDWHEIPSLKAMLYEDAMDLREKIKEMEKGAFFAVKEAFKKVLPHQYQFLKELKDILVDRNSVKDL
ncbi:MAG TPA: hypothetical protein PKB07_21580 [Flavilitoribacter sp.]|nr:hypothetical protein [Flavilitoribacter sp.]